MEAKRKSDLGTKIFTAAFSIVLVALLVFALIFVAASPDFEPPKNNTEITPPPQQTVDENVWNYTMDDILDYFEEQGLIEKDGKQLLLTAIGTENWLVNGIEFIWWDVDNLEEGTDAYNYWNELQENDNECIIFGDTVYSFTAVNGPFAMFVRVDECPYPSELVTEAFNGFPSQWSGAVTTPPSVWDYNMDDLLDYLQELGYLDKSKKQLMSTVGTENWICNGIDLIWWDVENLQEGTEPYQYWNELQENDYLYIIYGTAVYSLTVNGPFAIHANAAFPGNVDNLLEDFKAFPGAWSGARTVEDDVEAEQ